MNDTTPRASKKAPSHSITTMFTPTTTPRPIAPSTTWPGLGCAMGRPGGFGACSVAFYSQEELVSHIAALPFARNLDSKAGSPAAL
jgi:hypothetical protein